MFAMLFVETMRRMNTYKDNICVFQLVSVYGIENVSKNRGWRGLQWGPNCKHYIIHYENAKDDRAFRVGVAKITSFAKPLGALCKTCKCRIDKKRYVAWHLIKY